MFLNRCMLTTTILPIKHGEIVESRKALSYITHGSFLNYIQTTLQLGKSFVATEHLKYDMSYLYQHRTCRNHITVHFLYITTYFASCSPVHIG